MTEHFAVKRIPVTLANIEEEAPKIIAGLESALVTGIDIETADPRRHAGLIPYNGKSKRLVFDINRTDLCGVSLWPDESPCAWYLNVGHADIEGRIPWPVIQKILETKPINHKWVIHNAAFERTMFNKTVGWDIQNYLCTLVMAVSAYGPDEYDIGVFNKRNLGGIASLLPEILKADPEDFQDLLSKVIAKESDANHSYNGYVKEIAYGFGLKKAVKSWFNYQMVSFEECLKGHAHMGELTTEETAQYGCDDAIWCVRLLHRLLKFMKDTNPAVIKTYLHQENPMVEIYSESWRTGVRIDAPAVEAKDEELRVEYANKTRAMKRLLCELLPFPEEPNKGLIDAGEEWYEKNHAKYRKAITDWANSPNSDDPFVQATQLSGAIPNAWAEAKGLKVPKGLNLTHYMPMRVLMYDLFNRKKPIIVKGKVQSDTWARGRLKDALKEETAVSIMSLIGEMATIETASKLFLTPYRALLDPETNKLYPIMGSELASRRMSMATPNPQQLAKRGDSVYVRGFYLPDYPDHVIVSLDWSQIELVLIGEMSGDPYFHDCFSQIPYNDLHIIAAADNCGVTTNTFKMLKRPEEFLDVHGPNHPLLLNPKGEKMDPSKAFKWWRTEIGKGSNFEYWYSGALSNVGQNLDWTSEQMWAATDKYRSKFSVAEKWRKDTIEFAKRHGYVPLPDGHRRSRYESTYAWANTFRAKWPRGQGELITKFSDAAIKRIQSRANNQAVNSKIQGSNATLVKRSSRDIAAEGWKPREARFMFPIHDELVFSVHRDLVTDFLYMARSKMVSHPDIIKTLKMDCSPSVGLTFQPWDAKKAPIGQIELYESPEFDFIPREYHDGRIPEEMWPNVIDYLFKTRDRG